MKRSVLILLLVFAVACTKEQVDQTAHAIDRSKEISLRTQLKQIRGAIEAFRNDQGRCPTSLAELQPQYMVNIPADPVTGTGTTWVYSNCEVKSGAPGKGSDGTEYSSW